MSIVPIRVFRNHLCRRDSRFDFNRGDRNFHCAYVKIACYSSSKFELRLYVSMLPAVSIMDNWRHHIAVVFGTPECFSKPCALTNGSSTIRIRSRRELDLSPCRHAPSVHTALRRSRCGSRILCASWISCFFYYFPTDPVRSFFGGILSLSAPWLVYSLAKRVLGLHASLSNLTARRLLLLIVLYALASPALH